MLAACSVGTTFGEVLRVCDAAYTDAGHPGAWREHYQGGPIAYRQREFEVAPAPTDEPLFTRAASPSATQLAWNPSVDGGGKAEDTYLVSEGGLQRAHRLRRLAAARRRAPAALDVLDIATAEPPREGRRRARATALAVAPRRRAQATPASRTAPTSASRSRASRARACWPRSFAAPEAAGITVNRVSQGSGAMLLSEPELREMAALGAEAGIEVSLFVGPREGFDVGAHARSADGSAHFGQLRGARGLAYAVEDVARACEHGIRSFLIADLGLLTC